MLKYLLLGNIELQLFSTRSVYTYITSFLLVTKHKHGRYDVMVVATKNTE